MNWYYASRIGLDMAYFWRRILPIVGSAAAAVALCLAGTHALPVSGWGLFIAWGAAYTAVYAGFAWGFALSAGERDAVRAKLRRA